MKKLITIICLLFIANSSFGKVRFVRATFHGDASSQVTIGWDQESSRAQLLEYALVESFESKIGHKIDRRKCAKGMHNNFVRLTGLEANTKYYFRIKDKEGYSNLYMYKRLQTTSIQSFHLSLVAILEQTETSEY